MNAICRIELEIGLMTKAGPRMFLCDTITLSTKGWSSFLIQREKDEMSF